MKTILIAISSAILTFAATAETAPAPTKTLVNLTAAWQGESNAKVRYHFFAEKAEKDGEKQAARPFRATSKAEEIHAAEHAKVIKAMGGTLEHEAQPVDLSTLQEDLQDGYSILAAEAGLTLGWHPEPGLLVRSDPSLLCQIRDAKDGSC